MLKRSSCCSTWTVSACIGRARLPAAQGEPAPTAPGRRGRFTAEDIEEAVSTAVAVGDFDVSGANHHGTPQERRAAWLDGFESGDPSVCARYVPV